jgi:hypothetical protein
MRSLTTKCPYRRKPRSQFIRLSEPFTHSPPSEPARPCYQTDSTSASTTQGCLHALDPVAEAKCSSTDSFGLALASAAEVQVERRQTQRAGAQARSPIACVFESHAPPRGGTVASSAALVPYSSPSPLQALHPWPCPSEAAAAPRSSTPAGRIRTHPERTRSSAAATPPPSAAPCTTPTRCSSRSAPSADQRPGPGQLPSAWGAICSPSPQTRRPSRDRAAGGGGCAWSA